MSVRNGLAVPGFLIMIAVNFDAKIYGSGETFREYYVTIQLILFRFFEEKKTGIIAVISAVGSSRIFSQTLTGISQEIPLECYLKDIYTNSYRFLSYKSLSTSTLLPLVISLGITMFFFPKSILGFLKTKIPERISL